MTSSCIPLISLTIPPTGIDLSSSGVDSMGKEFSWSFGLVLETVKMKPLTVNISTQNVYRCRRGFNSTSPCCRTAGLGQNEQWGGGRSCKHSHDLLLSLCIIFCIKQVSNKRLCWCIKFLELLIDIFINARCGQKRVWYDKYCSNVSIKPFIDANFRVHPHESDVVWNSTQHPSWRGTESGELAAS